MFTIMDLLDSDDNQQVLDASKKKKTINKSRQFKVALVMECWNVWNLTYDMKAAEPVLQEI